MKALDWITLIGASAAALIIGQTATAQSNQCAERHVVLASLASDFGETRRSIAMSQDDSVVEVIASSNTGTWTIIVTTATGMTCMVASGEAYEQIAGPTAMPDV